MTDVETIVIGAGAVGLAVAKALAERGQSVLVVERHDGIGTETSSRNSEVIHAGIYYPEGSLKARLCVEGKKMLYRFAEAWGVTIKRAGKLIVATSREEEDQLRIIHARARAAGVDDLLVLDELETKAREGEVTATKALLSPSTAVIDSHGYMQALEGAIEHAGGQVVLSANVSGLALAPAQHFAVTVTSGGSLTTLSARNVINAAGLDAPRVSHLLMATRSADTGFANDMQRFAKGHYYALQGRNPFRHLVYPAPSGAWLGIHLTLDVAGAAKFGPDHDWIDEVDYHFDDSPERRQAFETAIRRYWPNLADGALVPGYTGIRPKIYAPGMPAADFGIRTEADHGIRGYIALHGIESPGLTSSLAIGDYVSEVIR